MKDVDPAVARRMWHLLEPYHASVYFAPEVRDAMKGVGLKGFWMGYFAGRSAPLGEVGPEVVTALFFGFHPDMVARALPDAWRYASPAAVLEARTAAVGSALERILGDDVASPAIAVWHGSLPGAAGAPSGGSRDIVNWPASPAAASSESGPTSPPPNGANSPASVVDGWTKPSAIAIACGIPE